MRTLNISLSLILFLILSPGLSARNSNNVILVLIGKRPFKSPTSSNINVSDARVKEILDEMVRMYQGRVIEYPAPEGDLIQWYGKLQSELGIKPFVSIDQPHKYLSQSTYNLAGNPMFLMANTSLSEAIPVKVHFRVEHLNGERQTMQLEELADLAILEPVRIV